MFEPSGIGRSSNVTAFISPMVMPGRSYICAPFRKLDVHQFAISNCSTVTMIGLLHLFVRDLPPGTPSVIRWSGPILTAQTLDAICRLLVALIYNDWCPRVNTGYSRRCLYLLTKLFSYLNKYITQPANTIPGSLVGSKSASSSDSRWCSEAGWHYVTRRVLITNSGIDAWSLLLACPRFIIISSLEFLAVLHTYKALHEEAPRYMLTVYQPRRTLRSMGSVMLVVPRVRTSIYGERKFQCSAAKLWNALPAHIREFKTLNIFRMLLKTHLFSSHIGV